MRRTWTFGDARRPGATGVALAVLALACAAPRDARAQSGELARYVLFAERSVHADRLTLAAGDVGANDAAAGRIRTRNDLAAPGSVLAAHVVAIGGRRSTCGAVRADVAAGTTAACGLVGTFVPPAIDIPTACDFPDPFPSCDPAASVVVASGERKVLPPGVYGDVLVAGSPGGVGTLVLDGDYTFCSLRIARRAVVTVSGPSDVRVAGTVLVGNGADVGRPASPDSVRWFIDGTRVRASKRATLDGVVCAPRAILRVDSGSALAGRLVARDIRVKRSAVTYHPGPTPGSTTTTTFTTTTTDGSGGTTSTTVSASTTTTDGSGGTTTTTVAGSTTTTDGSGGTTSTTVSGGTTTTVAPLPAPEVCGDCIDNDGNGMTDFFDPVCCDAAQTFDGTLRRVTVRPRRSGRTLVRLRQTLAGDGLAISPREEEVFVQVRQQGGTDLLCAWVPAGKFMKMGRAFAFWDRKGGVESDRGLNDMKLKARKSGEVRYRGFGRQVAMAVPADPAIEVVVALRPPDGASGVTRCSTAAATLRRGKKGSLRLP